MLFSAKSSSSSSSNSSPPPPKLTLAQKTEQLLAVGISFKQRCANFFAAPWKYLFIGDPLVTKTTCNIHIFIEFKTNQIHFQHFRLLTTSQTFNIAEYSCQNQSGMYIAGCTNRAVQRGLYRKRCTERVVQSGLYRESCTEMAVQRGLYREGCTDRAVQRGLYREGCTSSVRLIIVCGWYN